MPFAARNLKPHGLGSRGSSSGPFRGRRAGDGSGGRRILGPCQWRRQKGHACVAEIVAAGLEVGPLPRSRLVAAARSTGAKGARLLRRAELRSHGCEVIGCSCKFGCFVADTICGDAAFGGGCGGFHVCVFAEGCAAAQRPTQPEGRNRARSGPGGSSCFYTGVSYPTQRHPCSKPLGRSQLKVVLTPISHAPLAPLSLLRPRLDLLGQQLIRQVLSVA